MKTRLLTEIEVRERVGATRSSFLRGVKSGFFPRPIKVGPRQVRWREDEIDAAIERLTAERDEAGQ